MAVFGKKENSKLEFRLSRDIRTAQNVDGGGIHFAPPQKPWNDEYPVNKVAQDFVHPPQERIRQMTKRKVVYSWEAHPSCHTDTYVDVNYPGASSIFCPWAYAEEY